MKTLVIIPTYNEKENIPPLMKALLESSSLEVLVVDDNSPDGTAQTVQELQKIYPGRLHLLQREKKEGLGRAYIAGFHWALEKSYERVVQMDADFSHRPEDLFRLLKEDADVVVGSRWVKGGGTKNWSWLRILISRCGSFYARVVLGYPLKDWTGGFNLWKASVLRGISLDKVQSEGYSFQIEMKFRALQKGFRVVECPILFEERRVGQSKMSLNIVLEALYRVWFIKFIKVK
ncbi:MAG: polyprenol monophosphomannose synthase [Bdellovibrio sp.]|nr:MAG: polyprenol monophosphomannose synthase [Bdellovibrio sp.]